MAELGRLDILVNNAGRIRRSSAAQHSDEDGDLLIEVNQTAAFRMSLLAGKRMLEQGSGKIVNIASLPSFQGEILVPACGRGQRRRGSGALPVRRGCAQRQASTSTATRWSSTAAG